MPAGPFKGRKLSPTSPSPALQVLKDSETLILPTEVPKESWAVSNLWTQTGPAVAIVPRVAPSEVTLLREREVDGTFHLLLRLQYSKEHPIRFWPQNWQGLAGSPQEVWDVVIDFGTQRVLGEERTPFNVWRGLTGQFALQARMGTSSSRIRRIRFERREVVEFPMSLTEEQRFSIIRHFIVRSRLIGRGEMYNSIVKNCATEFSLLFDVVGEGLCHQKSPLSRSIYRSVSWIPSGLLWALRRQGWEISDQAREIELAEENRK